MIIAAYIGIHLSMPVMITHSLIVTGVTVTDLQFSCTAVGPIGLTYSLVLTIFPMINSILIVVDYISC